MTACAISADVRGADKAALGRDRLRPTHLTGTQHPTTPVIFRFKKLISVSARRNPR